MKTCAFYTLGCKVNQYETQAIRENFIKAGYKERDFSRSCHVYVINTCTVTEKTDKESRRLMRKAHRQNPRAKIVVTGCYAELDRAEINAIDGVSFIIKNKDKDKIADIVDSKKTARRLRPTAKYPEPGISDFKDRSKAFLKIQDGCNNLCSYCKVPIVRGYSRSRNEEAVIAEAKRLLKKGFKEIVLTGICLGSWGEEYVPEKSIEDLLRKLTAIKGDFRIRLSSIEPKYANNGLLGAIKRSPKICKHLHMPLQSGDDKILKMMNRPYTFREYAKIAQNARRKVPSIAITTDILIGFPSEGSKNFRNTCKLMARIRPSRIHIFPYSRREGTAASKLQGELPKNVVAGRIKVMKALAEQYSYEFRKKFKDKIVKVLVEAERDKKTGFLKGYDDHYINVLISGTLGKKNERYISKVIPVRIQKVDKELTLASLI
ncbi:MAG: tRNA (N(6)-L-threonylcarbamoyladenosine(37)-C(2))-methylthiotransferase MtaB [Candidatus Omnitrophota bacterium]